MSVSIVTLDKDKLNLIGSLWEKLNAQHHEKSTHFKGHFERQTFESRSAKWRKMPEECVHISAAQDSGGAVVGYCVCSVQDDVGELDSIYVEPEFRGQDVGNQLAADGVNWLKGKGCRQIDVLVAEGNENVFPFYEKLGFRLRCTMLQMI